MLIRYFHRRNLPHLYYNEGIYFVTYRLYGSIHSDELKQLKLLQISNGSNQNQQKKIFKKYDALLDKPSCVIQYLKHPEIMEICKASIHYYNGNEYKLICYCIMPNHIHLIFELLSKERNVGDIIGSIKKYSARDQTKLFNKMGDLFGNLRVSID